MSALMNPAGSADAIVVSVILDGAIARALDQACSDALSSRAGFVRRVVAEALRESGHMPPLPNGPRHVARTRP